MVNENTLFTKKERECFLFIKGNNVFGKIAERAKYCLWQVDNWQEAKTGPNWYSYSLQLPKISNISCIFFKKKNYCVLLEYHKLVFLPLT